MIKGQRAWVSCGDLPFSSPNPTLPSTLRAKEGVKQHEVRVFEGAHGNPENAWRSSSGQIKRDERGPRRT